MEDYIMNKKYAEIYGEPAYGKPSFKFNENLDLFKYNNYNHIDETTVNKSRRLSEDETMGNRPRRPNKKKGTRGNRIHFSIALEEFEWMIFDKFIHNLGINKCEWFRAAIKKMAATFTNFEVDMPEINRRRHY